MVGFICVQYTVGAPEMHCKMNTCPSLKGVCRAWMHEPACNQAESVLVTFAARKQ